MIGVWRSLLWKEWREQRSAIAVLTAFFVTVPALFSLRTPTNYFGALSIVLLAVPLASMFVAMNIAAGEQSAKTIGFLQSLPATQRKAALAKLFWGVISVTVPIVLAVGVAALLHVVLGEQASDAITRDASNFGYEKSNWYATRLVVPCVAAVSYLLWIAAPGVNQSDEVRAAAVGLLVAISFWGAVGLLSASGFQSQWIRCLLAIGPGGIAFIEPPNLGLETGRLTPPFTPYAQLMLIVHVALGAWFVLRFGRVPQSRLAIAESSPAKQTRTWLAPPFRSGFSSIVWKQTRESLPLGLLGAAAIAMIGLFVYFASRSDVGPEPSGGQILFGAAYIWLLVGIGVSTVAGIGVFTEDLSPGLNTFWRSRPIGLGQWFVVKYVVGLLVTIVTLAIPLLATAFYAYLRPGEFPANHDAYDARNFILVGALVQVGVYNSAVAAIVFLRRPIHAAFGAIAFSFLVFIGVVTVFDVGARATGLHEAIILTLAGLIAIVGTLGLTWAAWLAVRFDWGWKR